MPAFRFRPAVFGVAVLALPLAVAGAQAAEETLRVFLDCQTSCDFDHLRREITYVSWVRDRNDANVHLLLTSQSTGGGGRAFLLRFIGLGSFRGLDDEITLTTQLTDTEDDIRSQQAQRIGLGLARYAARTAAAPRLRVGFAAPDPEAEERPLPGAKDPWNLWVFTIGLSGDFSGESQSSRNNLSASAQASRIDERWKFRTQFSAGRNHSRFNLEEGDSVLRTTTRRYDWNSALARSIGGHWSGGLSWRVRRSSVDNWNLWARVVAGLEYDVFPYSESSKRQVVFVYEVGVEHARYADTTVYNKLRETHPLHSGTAAFEATQPWGSVEVGLVASGYLHDLSKNRVSLEAAMSVRLIRGLTVEVSGEYARVRDQLGLPREGATDEEILLELRQLKTDYSYSLFLGFNFSFGSKLNNVVNPRFNNSHYIF